MDLNFGAISSINAMFAAAAAIRGSVSKVAGSGGGVGAPLSQASKDRARGSSASRKLSAVEPVRGSPSPNNGAAISCSSISG